MEPRLPSRDLVLIGAGHTNLHVVRMWRMAPIDDVRLTLVSPFGQATYSGMLPGVLAGLYERSAMEIDLARFANSCGARLILAPAIGLDPTTREVLFADRPPIRYDAVSIGVGSVPADHEAIEDATKDATATTSDVLAIKPMATFIERLDAQVERAILRGDELSIAVVGGGAGGVEIAFALRARFERRKLPVSLALVDRGEDLLASYLPGVRDKVRRRLAEKGIDVHLGQPAIGYSDRQLHFADGAALAATILIWAVGAAPSSALASFQLPKASDGFIAVRPTLQSISDDAVFAVGDSATIEGHPLPKAGVYAVRQGPVLWRNLRRYFSLPRGGETLEAYRPQSGFLSLLSTGDSRAIGQYKGYAFEGKWAWRWKDHIDRKFMRMYQDYAPMPMDAENSRAANGLDDRAAQIRCRGCGGKVGAGVLSQALAKLPEWIPGAATPGPPEDAAVLGPAMQGADVTTVDFFEAFIDDPYLTGRIAAVHALSDLWATGAEPLGAMAIVTLPRGSEKAQTELLSQTLAGAVRELTAAGASLLGGHTTEADSFLVGFSAFGRLAGKPPLLKSGLRFGDRLILTKAIGVGVLLAAHMQSRCRAEWLQNAIANMLVSNAAASRLAWEHGASAVTDVTGFGLCGHLMEMLASSGVGARIDLRKIPLLDGFEPLAGEGVQSTLDAANRGQLLLPDSFEREILPAHVALFDPQTAGGLLIGAPADKTEALLAELRASGYPQAVEIGETVRAAPSSVAELKLVSGDGVVELTPRN